MFIKNMFKDTFENYLQEVYAKEYHGTDDDMPDAFEAWLAGLEQEDIIRYAEEVVANRNAMIEGLTKIAGKSIDELKRIQTMANEPYDRIGKRAN